MNVVYILWILLVASDGETYHIPVKDHQYETRDECVAVAEAVAEELVGEWPNEEVKKVWLECRPFDKNGV